MQSDLNEKMSSQSRTCVLFMSKVDARFCVKPEIIRSNLFMYSLFADELCIADSMINNHPHLRKLIWPPESKKIEREVNCDVKVMLEKGFLRPVVRKGFESFSHLWKMQNAGHTPNLPPLEYAEYLDSINIARYEYDLLEVSKRFTNKAKNSLKYAIEVLPSLSAQYRPAKCSEAINSLLDHICDAHTNVDHKVLYNKLLKTMENNTINGCEFEWINNFLNDAYAHNVPATLGMPVCADYRNQPIKVEEYRPDYQNSPTTKTLRIKFPWVFSKYALNILGIDTLTEIRKLNEYELVRNALNDKYLGTEDLESFAGNLEKYGEKLSNDLADCLSHTQIEKLNEINMPNELEVKRVLSPEECSVSIEPVDSDNTEEHIFIKRTFTFTGYNAIHKDFIEKKVNSNLGVIFREKVKLDE